MSILKKILAFEERPYNTSPEPDGSFDRENQAVEIGMPEMNRIQLKEALLVRPYNLGKENRFLPDPVTYPALYKMLTPKMYCEPKPEPKPLQGPQPAFPPEVSEQPKPPEVKPEPKKEEAPAPKKEEATEPKKEEKTATKKADETKTEPKEEATEKIETALNYPLVASVLAGKLKV